jgi:uncharacterized protein (TIGR02118 family)
MLTIMAFLTRRQDLDTQAFIDHYENRHVPLIRGIAALPITYRRYYLVRGDALNHEGDGVDFDVVTELGFADRDGYLAWARAVFAPGTHERVAEDEARFLERARTRAFVVDQRVTTPVAG